ncbi:Z1 domain-containing protein [Candidatus Bipolaricaulota bacterium]
MFLESDAYLEIIPSDELPTEDDSSQPPPSLFRAMRLFFLGAADWAAKQFPETAGTRHRSMMVHPSRLRDSHATYARWMRSRIHVWLQILENEGSRDFDRLLTEFQEDYVDLEGTVSTIRPFDELVAVLRAVLLLSEVRVVNMDQEDPEIDWARKRFWLLVGGANLDRGFTVEGLTVTYMPRGAGVGNADTIQQRARFYGYKKAYIEYCRVFLEADVSHAFLSYIEHEQSIHNWLVDSIKQGVPLGELSRRFIIDPGLRPTRYSILTDSVRRIRSRSEWFSQREVLESVDDCRSNLRHLENFIRRHEIEFAPNPPISIPDLRTEAERHFIAENLSLRTLYQELMADLRVPGSGDHELWLATVFLIEHWLEEHPDATATIVRMRPTRPTPRALVGDKIQNPFQGARPVGRGDIYPGDSHIHSCTVTLQVHILDLYEGRVSEGILKESQVPVFAVWLAEELRQDQVVAEGDLN